MIKFSKDIKEVCKELMQAIESGDSARITEAWENLHESIVDNVIANMDEKSQENLKQFDKKILQARGVRQLTNQETRWYNKLIDACKSKDPKQAFIEIIGTSEEEDVMPTTIFEQIYKDLEEDYPLFSILDFHYVGYITKWILNDNTRQLAVWGEINSEITKEITSGLRVVKIDQNKLSAFAQIPQDMLVMGPEFLDTYLRTCLQIALLNGFEEGIINGNGLNEPIGMIKDIHHGVSVDTTTGYPNKETVTITSFSPKDYGEVLANLAQTESWTDAGGVVHGGRMRKFDEVALICNQVDYLTKIMPATVVQNVNGAYIDNIFPFPTKVIRSNAIETGKAILCLPDKYFLAVGGERNGQIEYSDEYKFLEDVRTFKIKQFGTGRFEDNTCAIYLDISELDPAYITVATNVSA